MKYIFIILYINCCYSQSTIQFPDKADWIDKDSNRIYHINNKKILISAEGQMLEQVFWGHCSDCGGEPNGAFISWFKNHQLKEIGTYACSEKINTWINYYENGKIKTISTFIKPYDQDFYDDVGNMFNLKNKPLKNGTYIEFDSSGLIIIEGNYKIYEEFSKIDTIKLYDPVKYVPYDSIIVKECWLPKSIEVGTWRKFNPNLNDYETINFDELNKHRKLRSIYNRYVEVFQNLFK